MKWVGIGAILFSSFIAAPALSQETDDGPAGTFSIGPSLSTLGIGLEVGYRPSNYLGFRVGGNFFNYDTTQELQGIEYEGSLELKSAGLIADLHPFGGGFRISLGARLNLNEASLEATPTESQEIGGVTYTPAQIGTISGDVEFNRFAPYVGLGYEGAPFPTDAFTLGIEAGVMYHGEAEVSLSATGEAGTAGLADDLEAERQEVEDDIGKYKFYPVVMLTAKLRF